MVGVTFSFCLGVVILIDEVFLFVNGDVVRRGRPKGSKTGVYTVSESVLARNNSACLTRKRKKVGKDGCVESFKDKGKL